jgi:uncharacterized membrane protein
MWSRSELKEIGKAAFKQNYWRCVLVAFILALLTAGSSASGSSNSTKQMENSMSQMGNEELAAFFAALAAIAIIFVIVWTLLRIFLLNLVEVGCHSFLKKNITDPSTNLEELKIAFGDYKRSMLTMLLRDVFLALWYCLLIIPGVIKSYSYCMVPYILLDNPELGAKEVITRSREMMNGNKWKTFVLDLSFIGWMLLSFITCGLVGIFYEEPYRRSTRAALYLKLRDGAGA